MNTTTIIVAVVLLVLGIIPVLILNKYGKGNKYEEEI